MFSAKAMVVTGSCNNSAIVKLKIKIDGVERGSHGVQGLGTPNVGSGRTLTASYLSTNPVLSAGSHTVQVVGNVTNVSGAAGSYFTLGMSRHLPLIYFD